VGEFLVAFQRFPAPFCHFFLSPDLNLRCLLALPQAILLSVSPNLFFFFPPFLG